MQVTVEALGPKSGNRLLGAGATRIMIPCVHALDDAINAASQVRGPVTLHVPANRIIDLHATRDKLADNGIASILAVSGNPVYGPPRYDVYDVIEHFSTTGFQVAAGGYPEGYLGSTSARHRARSVGIVARKQAAGAASIITQASFNATNMGQWLVALRRQGVSVPVHIGVMPAVPARVIAKMMIRAVTENRDHPVRQINRPNIDLLYRTLRSHLHNVFRFVQATRQSGALGPADAFHVFSGAQVDELVGRIRAMAP